MNPFDKLREAIKEHKPPPSWLGVGFDRKARRPYVLALTDVSETECRRICEYRLKLDPQANRGQDWVWEVFALHKSSGLMVYWFADNDVVGAENTTACRKVMKELKDGLERALRGGANVLPMTPDDLKGIV